MSNQLVENFLHVLKKSPPGAVFNPWWQVDKENDVGPRAPRIRRQQLRAYLRARIDKARIVIVGEALGYRGGHFTGIPMTSERMLIGKIKAVQIDPKQIVPGNEAGRTSRPDKCRDGFSEPTATIVWGALLKLELKPDEFVLWNAFPWHSFDRERGVLSNRGPNKSEQSAGLAVLKAFLKLFPCEQVVALGKIAAAQLEKIRVEAHCVRHPASGGAKLFRQQIAKVAAPTS